MKYAVLTPEKLLELDKQDKLAKNKRYSDAPAKGFDGYFEENYKDGIPFIVDYSLKHKDIIETDTVETPDIRPQDTQERAEITQGWAFKEDRAREGETRLIKQVKGKIDKVEVLGQISHEIYIADDISAEEMIVDEVRFAVANAAREKHFEQLSETGKVPFLMRLERE